MPHRHPHAAPPVDDAPATDAPPTDNATDALPTATDITDAHADDIIDDAPQPNNGPAVATALHPTADACVWDVDVLIEGTHEAESVLCIGRVSCSTAEGVTIWTARAGDFIATDFEGDAGKGAAVAALVAYFVNPPAPPTDPTTGTAFASDDLPWSTSPASTDTI